MINLLGLIGILFLVFVWGVFLWGLKTKSPKKWWLVGAGVGVGVSLVSYTFSNNFLLFLFPGYFFSQLLMLTPLGGNLVGFDIVLVLVPLYGSVFGLIASRDQKLRTAAIFGVVLLFVIGFSWFYFWQNTSF